MLSLEGITVLDFSTLLPGPMASLVLAEAGADVVKIERPEMGDDMRHYPPMDGTQSANFKLLNRGKQSITVDLKDADTLEKLTPHVEKADIIIEQFRPGVMDRLGLGYEALKLINPAIIYCSITGYGQTGSNANKAGHDLNYVAESGLLSLTGNEGAMPSLPPALIADIGGGAYPAIINILLALRVAEKTGAGQHLDISMSDNVFPFMFLAQAQFQTTGSAPKTGEELLFGGSPRYQIYETLDGRHLAAAPLEEKFWQLFCALIDQPNPDSATIDDIAHIIKTKTANDWNEIFRGQDVCCSIVATYEEALAQPHIKDRKLYPDAIGLSLLPTPLAPSLKNDTKPAPALGEDNSKL